MGDIVFENFSVNFKTRNQEIKALRGMSIVIKSNRITGIVGESGCGKSVLSLSILDLLTDYAQTQGKIYYGNKELTGLEKKQRQGYLGLDFGYISQNPAESLNPIRRVKKQFYEAIKVLEKASRSRLDRGARAEEILSKLGFENPKDILSSYPFQLSGGMQQRVLTGIALSSQPKWILADEPTKGLDASLRQDSLNLFKGIGGLGTKSILLITHDIDFANSLCDEIMVMYSGQVVEVGQNVFDDPKHPYTRGFVEALPSRGMKIIDGKTISPGEDVKGCRFANRCKFKLDRCLDESPDFYRVGDGQVRCFLYDGN